MTLLILQIRKNKVQREQGNRERKKTCATKKPSPKTHVIGQDMGRMESKRPELREGEDVQSNPKAEDREKT